MQPPKPLAHNTATSGSVLGQSVESSAKLTESERQSRRRRQRRRPVVVRQVTTGRRNKRELNLRIGHTTQNSTHKTLADQLLSTSHAHLSAATSGGRAPHLLPPFACTAPLIKATRPCKQLTVQQFHDNILAGGKNPLGIDPKRTTLRCALPFNGISESAAAAPATNDAAAAAAAAAAAKDIDSGYAWVILAVVFVINASTFGSARAYGLIFDKVSEVADDPNRFKNAALPFTVMGAVENMAGPLTGYLLSLTNSWRLLVFLGSLLITCAHLLAALSGSLVGQLLTMGLMCGLGLSFVTMSFFQINNAYFERYRSTAFGIGLAGAAIGAFYITPVCSYFLDHYSISACYLILSLLLSPNVPLALLLKPKVRSNAQPMAPAELDSAPQDLSVVRVTTLLLETVPVAREDGARRPKGAAGFVRQLVRRLSGRLKQSDWRVRDKHRLAPVPVVTVASLVDEKQLCVSMEEAAATQRNEQHGDKVWPSVKQVLINPLFHLIWPTQMMFCWLNFVFGIIVVNFGKDKGLDYSMASELVPIWALGQLVGRMIMGSVVDLNFISHRLFTVLCFTVIGSTTWLLNELQLQDTKYNFMLLSLLVFLLSVFISNLYILFNGLVVKYMDTSHQALSIGISSFIGSFLLLPRANVIGHYRDSVGNYDGLLAALTCASFGGALIWLVVPVLFKRLQAATPSESDTSASSRKGRN